MLSFILSFFLNFFVTPVKAVELTPTLDLKTEKWKEETLKPSVAKQNTNNESPISNLPKSFFGSITKIDDNSIIINFENKNITLQLNSDATFINSKRQKIKSSELKVGQTILAMGYLNQDNSLDCRRIVVTDAKSIENNNQITTGQIADVSQSQSSQIFILIPFQNKNSEGYQIKIDSKTQINDTNQKKLKSSDTITKGKKVIIVMHPDNENGQTFYATKIIQLETKDGEPAESTPTPTE